MTFVKEHKKVVVSLVCILVLVCVAVVTAWAYFTSYVDADGRWLIRTSCDIELMEFVDGYQKNVAVATSDMSCDSVVRAYAYCPDEYSLVFESQDESSFDGDKTVVDGEWVAGDDGWYYFDGVLESECVTSDLVVSVQNADGTDIHETSEEQDFNVVVLCEAAPNIVEAWQREAY